MRFDPRVWRHALALQASLRLQGRAAATTQRASRRAVDPLGIEVLGPAPVIRPKPGEDCDYEVVGSIAELREYLQPALQDRIPFGADWETTSLNASIALPVGLSVSVDDEEARYVPVGHLLEPKDNLPVAEVLGVLQEVDAAGADSLWYNAGYDIEVMDNALDWEPDHWHDVQIAVFLVNSNVIELNLKTTALRLLGVKMSTLEELDEEWIVLSKKARKERPPKQPHQLPIAKVAPYGCDDAARTRQLWFHPEVQQAVEQQFPIFQLEEWLVPVMRAGNRHGVYLDVERLKVLQQEALAQLAALKPKIFQALGCEPFSLSRRAFLGETLFKAKAIGFIGTNPKKPDYNQWTCDRTKEGAVSTNKKLLDKYRRQHPVIPLLIQYNELEAQERNYIRKLIKAAQHFATQPWAQGRCRFAFNAIGVPTGRMKCGGAGRGGEAYEKGVVDVNGQSLPEHEKAPYLPNTRSSIIAPPGYVVLAADYNQIELRVAGNESREPVWIDAYQQDKDLHLVNAQKIADVREKGVIVTPDDKARRGGAKTTSFALLYGGDERTIARNAGIPVEQGKEILDAFYQGLPHLAAWIQDRHQAAQRTGQCRTFLGRIRHLESYFPPEPAKQHDFKLWVAWKRRVEAGYREAINHPIQGGAADLFKTACVLAHRAVDDQDWGPEIISPQIFWVHDELLWYVKAEWVTRVVPVLRAAMEFEVKRWAGLIPLKAEFEVGSRRLYARAKAAKAEKDQQPEEVAKWRSIAALPESSNYGELVPLAAWVAEYGSAREVAA